MALVVGVREPKGSPRAAEGGRRGGSRKALEEVSNDGVLAGVLERGMGVLEGGMGVLLMEVLLERVAMSLAMFGADSGLVWRCWERMLSGLVWQCWERGFCPCLASFA